MSLFATDYVWQHPKTKEWHKGFYMDEMMCQNLNGLPRYLKQSWDVVGIVSGHGKVRVGKSTLASQVGYYVAWLLMGGRMTKDKSTGKWYVSAHPKDKDGNFKDPNFNLKDNIVFTPQDLQKRARQLFDKYGRNQVIIYDEGRSGLDSAAAMTAINKAMQDFFQECGQYGHVILIVLPNFFKLSETYAIDRSLFLIDVYANRRLQRGYFSFYNEEQKEWLYIKGKKLAGSVARYNDSNVRPSFKGRYTKFQPWNKDEYEKMKADALKKKELVGYEKRWKKQRDAAFTLLNQKVEMRTEQIANEVSMISQSLVSPKQVRFAIEGITHKKLIEYDEDAVSQEAYDTGQQATAPGTVMP